MKCTKRSLITCFSNFYPESSYHACFDRLSVKLKQKPRLTAFDCVWTSDRCRPHSVTFGHYKFIKVLIATNIYFFLQYQILLAVFQSTFRTILTYFCNGSRQNMSMEPSMVIKLLLRNCQR